MIHKVNGNVAFKKIEFDISKVDELNRASGFMLGTELKKYCSDTKGKETVRSLVADSDRFSALVNYQDDYIRVSLYENNRVEGNKTIGFITAANNLKSRFTKAISADGNKIKNLPVLESAQDLINLIDRSVKAYLLGKIDSQIDAAHRKPRTEEAFPLLKDALRNIQSIFQ